MTARVWCAFALAAGLSCSALVGTTAAKEWCGEAAWFDDDGGLTASGETNAAGALSAAHPDLPFGTKVQVDNLANGRSVVVRINDRASFAQGRVILVSRAAAEELDMIRDGRADVRLSLVDGDRPRPSGCGEPDTIAEEEATTEPPTVGTATASAAADIAATAEESADAAFPSDPADEVLFQSEGRVEHIEPVDPPVSGTPPVSEEALADRFAVAFQAETWQEAEFAKMLAAFAPRIATRRPRIAAPSVTRRAKGTATPPGGLLPDLIAYLWSTEISMPHLARFEHKPLPSRLSQLTQ